MRSRRESWGIAEKFGRTNSSRLSAATKEELAIVRGVVAKAASDSFMDKNARSRGRIAEIVDKLTGYLATLETKELLEKIDAIEKLTKVGRTAFGWDEENPGRHATIKMEFGLSPEALGRLAARERGELEVEGKVVEQEAGGVPELEQE